MKFVSAISFLICFCMVAQRLDAARPGKDGATTNLIEQSCAQTKYKDLCISSLTSDPNSFPADKAGLALVAIRFVSSNASDVAENLKVMFNDTALNEPIVQEGLLDCLDEYLDASQQLDDAIAAMIVKAYADVEKWIKIAVADVHKCEEAFKGAQPLLLEQRNQVFIQLCEIALAISKIAETSE